MTQVIYSVSSFFYAVPAMVLLCHFEAIVYSTCTGPEYTSSCFVNLYAYTATSIAFLMGGIYLSFFRLDVQNVYLLAWCHTLWHTFLPLGVTHTLYELGRRC